MDILPFDGNIKDILPKFGNIDRNDDLCTLEVYETIRGNK